MYSNAYVSDGYIVVGPHDYYRWWSPYLVPAEFPWSFLDSHATYMVLSILPPVKGYCVISGAML
jgi:hypothetical protein